MEPYDDARLSLTTSDGKDYHYISESSGAYDVIMEWRESPNDENSYDEYSYDDEDE